MSTPKKKRSRDDDDDGEGRATTEIRMQDGKVTPVGGNNGNVQCSEMPFACPLTI